MITLESKCPLCGRKAYLSHDIVDGYDMGYSIGCPGYCLNDGVHGISTFEEDEKRGYAQSGFFRREDAEDWWKNRILRYEQEAGQ